MEGGQGPSQGVLNAMLRSLLGRQSCRVQIMLTGELKSTEAGDRPPPAPTPSKRWAVEEPCPLDSRPPPGCPGWSASRQGAGGGAVGRLRAPMNMHDRSGSVWLHLQEAGQSLCRAGHSVVAGVTGVPRCSEVACERCLTPGPPPSLCTLTFFVYILFSLSNLGLL